MTIHPTLLARYREILHKHRTVLPPGELTAITQLEHLDPCGILSLSVEFGEERAAEVLRIELAGSFFCPTCGADPSPVAPTPQG